MTVYTPVTSHEERLLDAWNDFADVRQAAERAMGDPTAPTDQRMSLHQQAVRAHQRVVAIFTEPTPADLEDESRKLTCEAFVLISAVGAFVAFFLPGLEANFWPVLIAFLAAAGLGSWSTHFLGRLARHLGRRM